jgi:hypothetical protein
MSVELTTQHRAADALSSVFEQILGCPRLDPEADLFDLGLTSLLVAQAVVLARRNGIGLAAPQVYSDRTLRRLLASARPAGDAASMLSPATGERTVPFAPSKAFVRDFVRAGEHYNIASAWSFSCRNIDLAIMNDAIRWLVVNHDELRLVVRRDADGALSQHIVPQVDANPLEQIDLSDRPPDEAGETAETLMADLQHGFRFSNDAPLYRFTAIKLRPGGEAILMILVHQFLTDGFGFRALSERLADVYRALAEGDDPSPLRIGCGESIKWAEWASRYAYDEALGEVKFWASLPWQSIRPLRRDFSEAEAASVLKEIDLLNESDDRLLYEIGAGREVPAAERRRVFRSQATVVTSVDPQRSERLFKLNQRYRSQDFGDIDVIALAVARSLQPLAQSPVFWIDTWTSRRGEALDRVDLTSTLGGVGEVVPIAFQLEDGKPDAELIARVRSARARFPRLGIGFRALKLLNDDPGVQSALADCPFPEISINYRAAMQYFYRGSFLNLKPYKGWIGQTSNDGKRGDKFQFRLSLTSDQRMQTAVRYNPGAYSVDTAMQVTERFNGTLVELIDRL